MRIALISDIHGYLEPLEAVLEDIDRAQVDALICLGDVATTGPQPHEVTDRLRALNIPGIIGNHDSSLIDPAVIAKRPESRWKATLDWCDAQLTGEDMAYLRAYVPWL